MVGFKKAAALLAVAGLAPARAAIDASLSLQLGSFGVTPPGGNLQCGAAVSFQTTVLKLAPVTTVSGTVQFQDALGNVLCQTAQLAAAAAVDVAAFSTAAQTTILTNLLAAAPTLTGSLQVSVNGLVAANAAFQLTPAQLVASTVAPIQAAVQAVLTTFAQTAGINVVCTNPGMITANYAIANVAMISAKLDGLDINDIASLALAPGVALASFAITGNCPCTFFATATGNFPGLQLPTLSLTSSLADVVFPLCSAPTVTASLTCTGPLPVGVAADIFIAGGNLLDQTVAQISTALQTAVQVSTGLGFNVVGNVPTLQQLLPATNLRHGAYTIVVKTTANGSAFPTLMAMATLNLNALCMHGMVG